MILNCFNKTSSKHYDNEICNIYLSLQLPQLSLLESPGDNDGWPLFASGCANFLQGILFFFDKTNDIFDLGTTGSCWNTYFPGLGVHTFLHYDLRCCLP